jgi:hypothetical protein
MSAGSSPVLSRRSEINAAPVPITEGADLFAFRRVTQSFGIRGIAKVNHVPQFLGLHHWPSDSTPYLCIRPPRAIAEESDRTTPEQSPERRETLGAERVAAWRARPDAEAVTKRHDAHAHGGLAMATIVGLGIQNGDHRACIQLAPKPMKPIQNPVSSSSLQLSKQKLAMARLAVATPTAA